MVHDNSVSHNMVIPQNCHIKLVRDNIKLLCSLICFFSLAANFLCCSKLSYLTVLKYVTETIYVVLQLKLWIFSPNLYVINCPCLLYVVPSLSSSSTDFFYKYSSPFFHWIQVVSFSILLQPFFLLFAWSANQWTGHLMEGWNSSPKTL